MLSILSLIALSLDCSSFISCCLCGGSAVGRGSGRGPPLLCWLVGRLGSGCCSWLADPQRDLRLRGTLLSDCCCSFKYALRASFQPFQLRTSFQRLG